MKLFTWVGPNYYLSHAILNALPNTNLKANKNYVIFATEMINKKFAISRKKCWFFKICFLFKLLKRLHGTAAPTAWVRSTCEMSVFIVTLSSTELCCSKHPVNSGLERGRREQFNSSFSTGFLKYLASLIDYDTVSVNANFTLKTIYLWILDWQRHKSKIIIQWKVLAHLW